MQTFSRADESLISEVELPASVELVDLAGIVGDHPFLMGVASPLSPPQVAELSRLTGLDFDAEGDCFLQFYAQPGPTCGAEGPHGGGAHRRRGTSASVRKPPC